MDNQQKEIKGKTIADLFLNISHEDSKMENTSQIKSRDGF